MTILGCYWAPGHQRPPDIDYIKRLQPPAIRVLDPNPNQLAIAHVAAPNALILPRDWALSEQHGDVKRDPVGTGKRHAQDWRQKLDAWQAGHTDMPPNDQIVVVGINEPHVWDVLPQVVEYTVAWLDECTRLNLRACALNLSVGWPANTGPDTPPNWTPYAPIEAAIKRGKHFLVLHEYWYRTGPRDGWGWLAGRLQHCPWDVPIIIGECGIDMYVDMQRWQNDGKPNRGWRGNVEPERYAVQMEDYARSIDKRVMAILPFLTDYRSNNWESFDTAEAHGRFLARKDNMTPQATPPVTVHIPSVGTGAKPVPMFVTAPAGVNVRNEPAGEGILTAIPYGEAVQAIGERSNWVQIRYRGIVGWVRSDLLSALAPETLPQPSEGPEPTPMPEPKPIATGIIDPRVAQAILRIESGGRTHGENGKPIIRFEAHIFRTKLGNDALWSQYFRTDPNKPWLSQEWRSHPDKPWVKLHTGSQGDEYAALSLALSLAREAAYQSISMGAGQIMGFNHARIGYPSAEAMFKAFQSAELQTLGFINFFLSDSKLMEAVRNRDWRRIAALYNGSGAVDTYAPLLQKAYEELS